MYYFKFIELMDIWNNEEMDCFNVFVNKYEVLNK